MQNPRLAARYAKSLMDVAIEKGKLDPLYQDMQGIQQMCKDSSELLAMLRSPVVNSDLKSKAIKALLDTKVDGVTIMFIELIIRKGREFYLPEIASSFISLYKTNQKIVEVVLTTAAPLDESVKAALQAKISQQFSGMTVELFTKVDAQLIGGFVLESNHKLFDASVLRDLKDIKKQFITNEYIANIR